MGRYNVIAHAGIQPGHKDINPTAMEIRRAAVTLSAGLYPTML